MKSPPRPSDFPTVSGACPRPSHPHAFARFSPSSWSAFCLSVPARCSSRALPPLGSLSWSPPAPAPMAVASLNSAALGPELGYCIPCGGGCLWHEGLLCLHPSGPAQHRAELNSRSATPHVPAVTRAQGIGCPVMEIRFREGGRNPDYVDSRGEWQVRAWRLQVQGTGWQRRSSPVGHVRPNEGRFQGGRDESIDGERGQRREQLRGQRTGGAGSLSGRGGPWPTDLEARERSQHG